MKSYNSRNSRKKAAAANSSNNPKSNKVIHSHLSHTDLQKTEDQSTSSAIKHQSKNNNRMRRGSTKPL
jgi:hypothetical protein